MKRGPRVTPGLGPLAARTVNLDERTVTLANVLGDNLSDGLRKAVRTAYRVYQRTPDVVPGEPCPTCGHIHEGR